MMLGGYWLRRISRPGRRCPRSAERQRVGLRRASLIALRKRARTSTGSGPETLDRLETLGLPNRGVGRASSRTYGCTIRFLSITRTFVADCIVPAKSLRSGNFCRAVPARRRGRRDPAICSSVDQPPEHFVGPGATEDAHNPDSGVVSILLTCPVLMLACQLDSAATSIMLR